MFHDKWREIEGRENYAQGYSGSSSLPMDDVDTAYDLLPIEARQSQMSQMNAKHRGKWNISWLSEYYILVNEFIGLTFVCDNGRPPSSSNPCSPGYSDEQQFINQYQLNQL
jgi:hypothetical protein